MATARRTKASDETRQIDFFRGQEPPRPETFRKAIEVVHSVPNQPLTLVQKKMASFLVKNAVETAPDAEGYFTVPVSVFADQIAYDSRNFVHLREAARALMSIILDWDVVSTKERPRYKASVLVPEIDIDGGVLRYQISHQILSKVLNPDVYARVDMAVVRRMRRAASIALYENCVRFINVRQTPELPLELAKDLLVGKDGSDTYLEYKRFKSKILVPCIAEVNLESEITLTMVEIKKGRSVGAIKFHVHPKVVEIASPGKFESTREMSIVASMVSAGMTQTEAMRLIKTYGIARAESALAYTAKREKNTKLGPLTDKAKYLRRALEEDYSKQTEEAVASTTTQSGVKQSLEDQYDLTRQREAEELFNEMTESEKTLLVDRYNEQQSTPGLKIKKTKVGRAAAAAFYRWMVRDTWGEPTQGDLLAFARKRLESIH